MLDVDKGGLLVDQDGGAVPLLLHFQHHRQKLVDDGHVHIATVITGDQGLEGTQEIHTLHTSQAWLVRRSLKNQLIES